MGTFRPLCTVPGRYYSMLAFCGLFFLLDPGAKGKKPLPYPLDSVDTTSRNIQISIVEKPKQTTRRFGIEGMVCEHSMTQGHAKYCEPLGDPRYQPTATAARYRHAARMIGFRTGGSPSLYPQNVNCPSATFSLSSTEWFYSHYKSNSTSGNMLTLPTNQPGMEEGGVRI